MEDINVDDIVEISPMSRYFGAHPRTNPGAGVRGTVTTVFGQNSIQVRWPEGINGYTRGDLIKIPQEPAVLPAPIEIEGGIIENNSRVMIRETSEFYLNPAVNNPRDTEGVVVAYNNVPQRTIITVQWPGGHRNVYRLDDLKLAPTVQQTAPVTARRPVEVPPLPARWQILVTANNIVRVGEFFAQKTRSGNTYRNLRDNVGCYFRSCDTHGRDVITTDIIGASIRSAGTHPFPLAAIITDEQFYVHVLGDPAPTIEVTPQFQILAKYSRLDNIYERQEDGRYINHRGNEIVRPNTKMIHTAANNEGNVFMVGDVVRGRTTNTRRITGARIQKFRMNNAGTNVCAVFSEELPYGIGIDKLEHTFTITPEEEIEEIVEAIDPNNPQLILERGQRLFAPGIRFNNHNIIPRIDPDTIQVSNGGVRWYGGENTTLVCENPDGILYTIYHRGMWATLLD